MNLNPLKDLYWILTIGGRPPVRCSARVSCANCKQPCSPKHGTILESSRRRQVLIGCNAFQTQRSAELKFADFHVGQVLQVGPYALNEAEVLAFAQQWDPQWFHVDPEAASRGPFKGLIASGWHTCGIAMRLVVDAFLAGSESFASPGLAYIKWPHPLRPDDEVSLQVSVLETRVSKSNPSLGVLRWRWQLHTAKGSEVLDLEATVLFKLQP